MTNSTFSLEGRKALVTGGATGIGQAIAIALAHAGADVAITVNQQPGEVTRAGVEAAGRQFGAFVANLAEPDAAERLFQHVTEEFGQVDILVNNAGIIRREVAEQFSDSDWSEVTAVNVDAVWMLSQRFGRSMLGSGSGRIINIASLLSFQGGIRVPAYAASKHAVLGLTRALANEWTGRGVTINAIAPGYIQTDNTAPLRADLERSRQILERIPAGRWGTPADIAGAAVFLASDAAAYISGQVLAVDGGWLAR
ncbi:2-deoxy-D-gluconate 3-dehydrogenase (plasmid) [Burkholderia pseudomallei]|uniref:2-deoxy-D-gluconate 3-dehydrogenase n=1 Tax=Burkholderia pseudomallei TaxID=28450 RepID=A0AA40JJ47_BURPE|nr:2-dehydro-3-deoxy-D-gluconate 5-dehydrogenase KduD [Burkholderia pseudomallei]AIV73768.1 2-deoxy-D-gluconate 3-dehydrogenase [Burkholderia pseudomallei]KGD54734.1 2-deoxy-D-gluconate 3-dehydrogenase [Burkholderia pseudomallei]KGX17169.1 2-deoxy-D-gluconate 3-dehydrogenase [Burkholderia pseudomallei]